MEWQRGEGKGMWHKMKDAAEATAERARTSGSFAGITLRPDGTLRYKREAQPVAGAVARVETAGDLQSRVTVSRMLLTGPFAFALKKKKDNRELDLTVEGRDATWVVELDPKEGAKAREFAATICTVGWTRLSQPDEDATALAPTVALDVADQLTKLAALRDQGILTDDEFSQQKSKLLG